MRLSPQDDSLHESSTSLPAGIITRDGEINAAVKEWKLVDVPELGYFTSDKPFPRGELLVLTETMIDGYYKHQDVSFPSASSRLL